MTIGKLYRNLIILASAATLALYLVAGGGGCAYRSQELQCEQPQKVDVYFVGRGTGDVLLQRIVEVTYCPATDNAGNDLSDMYRANKRGALCEVKISQGPNIYSLEGGLNSSTQVFGRICKGRENGSGNDSGNDRNKKNRKDRKEKIYCFGVTLDDFMRSVCR